MDDLWEVIASKTFKVNGGIEKRFAGKIMTKLSIFALAAMAALSVFDATGQGTLKKGPTTRHTKISKTDPTAAMTMNGLSPSEKQTAAHMMAMLTPEERAAMKKSSLMMSLMIDSQTPAHDQPMVWMNKSDEMQLAFAMKKMTPGEMAVAKKLMMNWPRMAMGARPRKD